MMFLLVVATFGDAVCAQTKEHRATAAYLHSFARFISGMDSGNADGEFVIGVLGENSCGDALHELAATKTAQGKQIRIRELSSFAEYDACDIIFVAGDVPRELQAAVIRQTDQQRVLVVAATPGFCQLGGTVNFERRADGSLGIEINIDAVSRQQLVVDAKLMKLATIVRDSRQNGLE